MCLVDDQHRNLCSDASQNLRPETLVRKAFRRDQEDVDLSLGQLAFNCRPVVHVVGVDRGGANPHPLCGFDLISHQREQRRDQ
ncbi:hypothetical protein FQZ97_621070 [compost metagenome]